MASFDPAIALVLKTESPKLLDDPQTGEYSRFGITAKTLKALDYGTDAECHQYVRDMDVDGAMNFYERNFWAPLLLPGVRDQSKANKIFDMAVNMGIPQAVKLLQRALNTLHSTLSVDGRMGPETLTCINGADAYELLTELRAESLAFYRALVEKNPALAKYWDGWKARAEK